MWNERFSSKEYIYGTNPNDFLKAHAKQLSGPVLSIAEGEGRNAVFLAQLGLEVHGVDASEVGLQKAQKLAEANHVRITTELADLNDFLPKENHYGAVVSISAHLPLAIRKRLYPRLEACLKPGGLLLLESYSEAQLEKQTGGPKEIDSLMSREKLKREFSQLQIEHLEELDREVIEGAYHTGLASVVQFLARKPA